MKSSKQSMMQQELFCSPEGFLDPASRLVVPGSEEARKMTVSSGRKCLELYRKLDPVGLLARMLLESSAWNSTIVFLTWKEKVTPSRRLLFQLAPSTPRTEGIGCGLLPTASADPPKSATPEQWTARMEKRKNAGKQTFKTPLHIEIAMLPTPRSGKMTDETEESWMRRKNAGNVATPPLSLAINLLPTVVNNAMLPTPATRDYKGARKPETMALTGRNPETNSLEDALVGKNRGLKLHSDFVSWMMGYPLDWLDLPETETESRN